MKKSVPPVRREDICFIREDGKEYCIDPLSDVLGVLARRWTLLIVGVVGNEPGVRFNALTRLLPGITARALSDRLQDLRRAGLVERHVEDSQSPPAVSYGLTRAGRTFRRALIPVLEWAEHQGGTRGRAPSRTAQR